MGLMCKYSCEECSFILCDSVKHEDIELEQGTILDNMQSVVELAKVSKIITDCTFVYTYTKRHPISFHVTLHDMV